MALKDILRRNDLTQEATARVVQVSLVTVGNWANERTKPTGENLTRLLRFLRQYEPKLEAEDLLAPAGPESEVA